MSPERLRLEGRTIAIRPARRREIGPLVRARNARTAHVRRGRREDASYRRRLERGESWTNGRVDLVLEKAGRVIGTIQAWRGWRHGLPPGVAEIGIWIDDADDRDRGWGSEAVRIFAEWLLAAAAERVQASTASGNAAARAALDRAGFRFEGVLRGYFPGESGDRVDYAMYGRLRD